MEANETLDIKGKIKKAFSFLKNFNSLFYYFIFLLGVGVIFFMVSLFTNHFTTPFSGDYNTQQYAFYLNLYDDWWHFIKTGSFRLFDMNTFLGVNNIGSNSFYSLFDPFFFIVLFFPRSWMGQMMAISTIIRMSLAGLVFYGYLRYMKVSDRSSRLAGVAFAYCGWTAWYLWFNCYTENALVFVLMLWGVEKIIRDKKPWFLMASIFLSGLVNYFFLVCFVMMAFVYAMFRWFQRLKENTMKDNWMILGIGFIAFVAGILMASIIALPSIMVALEAPRATSATYLDSLKEFLKAGKFKELFDYIFNWKNLDNKSEYRNLYPAIEFFFPAMSDRGTPLTQLGNETYDNVAGSTFCYYPFIILLVPAFIRSIKQKKWSHVVGVCLMVFTIFTPFFYYLFFGFTKPYSRWTIFVTTSLLTYTAEYLDHIKEEPKGTLIAGGLFTVIGIIAAAALAKYIVSTYSSFTERNNIMTAAIIAIVYVCGLTTIWTIFLNYKHIRKILYGFLVVEAGVMGALTIYGHGTKEYLDVNYGFYKNEALHSIVERINNDDKSYFRAYSTMSTDANKNDGARNDFNGVSFFHSVYNFDVCNFSYWSMILTSKSGWSGRYVEKRIGLDRFLGIKYYFLEKDRLYAGYANVPFDFVELTSKYQSDYFKTYMDTNHIDFALTYDDIYPYDEENDLISVDKTIDTSWTALRNDDLFLKGAILDKEQANKVIEEADGDLTLQPVKGVLDTVDAQRVYAKSLPNSSKWYSTVYKMSKVAKNMKIADIINQVNDDNRIVDPRPEKNSGLVYVIVIRPKPGNEDLFYDPKGMVFYCNANYYNSQKEDIYLIGDDDKVITGDNHNDDRGSDNTSRRGPRALYSRAVNNTPARKVKEIIIVPRWGTFNTREDVFYESYTSFNENKMAELKQYKVENVHYRDNHFDFTTNFDKQRFIVTQVAYDKGWSVKAKLSDGTTKKLDTYLSQGGFVGFLGEEGAVKYEMDYYTPYLRGGIFLSCVGSLIFLSTLLGYIYLDNRNRNKEIEEFLSMVK